MGALSVFSVFANTLLKSVSVYPFVGVQYWVAGNGSTKEPGDGLDDDAG